MYAYQCATQPPRDAEFAFQSDQLRIAATFKRRDGCNGPIKFIPPLLPASVKDIVPDPLLVDQAINRLSQLGLRPTRCGKLSVSACANVISAGGVNIDNSGAMQASNYATAFHSKIYPGRSAQRCLSENLLDNH